MKSSDAPPDTSAAAPGLVSLLAEDLRTYDFNLMEVGFWVTAAHRVRGWADRLSRPALRVPIRGVASAVLSSADLFFGIRLPAEVTLGRRVRIWHHGCIRLAARTIGNDVHVRPNTTFGPARGAPDDPAHWPVIGDNADIGAGVSILGNVRVGNDAFVGANSLVVDDVPPSSAVLGVPARLLPRRR
jgi:serine O-acetyltransferase